MEDALFGKLFKTIGQDPTYIKDAIGATANGNTSFVKVPISMDYAIPQINGTY